MLSRLYKGLCRIEVGIAAVLFVVIVVLSFLSAVTRKLGMPIQWAMDVTQLSFAWLAFLSGDIALRGGALPGFDLLANKMPKKVKAVVLTITRIFMLCLLVFFVYFGFKLAFSNTSRTFQTLPIKYLWVSCSLPVCSILMILSIISSFVDDFRKKSGLKEG